MDRPTGNSKSWAISLSKAYQYLMPTGMAIILFVLPAIGRLQNHENSILRSPLLRFAIWLYTAWMYRSLGRALKAGLNGRQVFYVSWMRKNAFALSLLILAALAMGTLLGLFTWWPLRVLAPDVPWEVAALIAVGNGMLYAALGVSQYSFLPEDD